MRSSIEHSGALNDDPRFTFRLVDMKHAQVHVDGLHGVASISLQVSDGELRDLIFRARCALEDCRLHHLFDTGRLTAEGYEAAKAKLDREGPPNEGGGSDG